MKNPAKPAIISSVDTRDKTIDYSKHSQKDLKTCLSNIDRNNHPQNFSALIQEIESRKKSGTWDEKASKFQDISSSVRGVWILICLIYLPAVFLSRIIYHYFAGKEASAHLQIAFFGVYFAGALFIRWKMGRQICPHCKNPIGALQLNSIVTYGKCPHCGYRGEDKNN